MKARHYLIPILALLSAPLAGCTGVELAGAGIDPAMTANAPDGPVAVDPNDDLAAGKQNFRDGAYGLAEQRFRRAVETSSNNSEAWLGLAAAHDELGRYDLADREYAQVEKRQGKSFELLNNRGYSRLMRGDYLGARRDLEAALQLRPDDQMAQSNLRKLEEKAGGRG